MESKYFDFGIELSAIRNARTIFQYELNTGIKIPNFDFEIEIIFFNIKLIVLRNLTRGNLMKIRWFMKVSKFYKERKD